MNIREPAVSGLFYPDQPDVLASNVDKLLKCRQPPASEIRALVVPHAGYIYSGGIAGAAFGCLPKGADYNYILLLGPSHRVAFSGMAVPRASYFRTPLGDVPVATEQVEQWVAKDLVEYSDLVHQYEHCLEVQLPFLQRMGIQSPVVPVVVGEASVEEVARLIQPVLNDARVLILISTDLSHYHPYDEARRIDGNTDKRIMAGACDIRGEEACGCRALNGLQRALRGSGFKIHRLQYANSGDSAGDRSQVVGYGAYAVY
ncbi:MAG: AmmeMemoRadiSam system protein B [Pontibacterium sp.]